MVRSNFRFSKSAVRAATALLTMLLAVSYMAVTAGAASAAEAVATPEACSVAANGRTVTVSIDDDRPDIVKWAIRADEVGGNGFAFLGKTKVTSNVFEAPFPDGKWKISARAFSAVGKSAWLTCGTTEIPSVPPELAPPADCTVVVDGRTVTIDMNDDRPEVFLWAIRATEVDGDRFRFVGRTNSQENVFEAPVPDGTWNFAARAISRINKSSWVSCDIVELPTTPPTPNDKILCEATLLAGGDTIRVEGLLLNGPANPDFAMSATNTATNEYVYLGAFTGDGSEFFLSLDGSLLEPGTWTIQARWKKDGERGARTDCSTIVKVGDDPLTMTCSTQLEFGSIRIFADDYNGVERPLIETFTRSAAGQTFLDSFEYGSFGTGFPENLIEGEQVDVVARWVLDNGDRGPFILCGSLIWTED